MKPIACTNEFWSAYNALTLVDSELTRQKQMKVDKILLRKK